MEDVLYIGRVANTHGVKGMIKVIPTTDDPKRFELLKEVLIEDIKGNTKTYTIEEVKYLKQFVLLNLKEVKTMDEAILLKQGIVKIPRDQALELAEDEYYISDLVGLKVNTDTGENLGVLKDVIFTGSNDVYVVKDKDNKEILLPAIKECVKQIDIENNIIIVHIMEGLM